MKNITLIVLLILFFPSVDFAQWITVSGTVYDITKKTPIEYVSVLSTTGRGAITDSAGHYEILVKESDSIYFSFLNKSTLKFAVRNIQHTDNFNISIQKKIAELPGITIKQRNYKLDSIRNREEYEKIFNYKKPGISVAVNPGMAVGLDINEFIRMFQFRKNRRMLSFQNRLINQENEKYISHRFSKGLVKKLTKLETPAIDSFMAEFRPTLFMVQQMNDLELGQYIVEAYKYYKAGIKVNRKLFMKEN